MTELNRNFPEIIDSTMRNDFASCGKKFEYSRIYGLASKGGSVHLVAGGAFAKGCEVIRKEFYEHGTDEPEAVYRGVIAAWEAYGAFDPGEKYTIKSAERVAYALVEYFTEYPLSTDKIQPYRQANGKPAIEFEFSFPLATNHPTTGNPLLYAGRFDMVGEFMSSLWVVDEKTASRLGPSWLKSFTLRGQLLGYCYAAQQFGLPVNGFIIRGISFLKDYYGHAEVIESVPQYRIEMWREQVEIDAARMVRDWENNRYNYSFGEACNAYGGCPYIKLCDKANWTDWWQQYFDVDYWNPIKQPDNMADKPILSFSS